MSLRLLAVFAAGLVAFSSPALAAGSRATLMRAAFATHDKHQALNLIDQAIEEAKAELARHPGDREARLEQALGVGYRGQLTRSPSEAKAARRAFEALVASDPRDPDARIAIAGWHLTAVGELGGFLAHTLLGASKAKGLAELERAVALGGNRAFYPAYAALIRIRLDPDDIATPLALARQAATAKTPEPIDRLMQRNAARLIGPLSAGKGEEARRLAKLMLPFGTVN